ncbi:RagB/SusD family nutrient uptake outer membrane protein [Fulvivirga sp. M361]|uniref:RagB/SusD family nutrient uptake outer membrane protein n=1 Tax=Fulvivirga sp. M361 TaxID=2594266 RepID=UPI00117A9F05|nr:RagB/SusD family nutrient uptake outer membrane protein [Fulvivirga sp. M361]TRX58455.1 RagB/SusD family nutrient uptake outer membrane protein [Fulvivirga sp. M361]
MKKFLKHKFILLLTLGTLVTSCEDYLEREPLGRFTEDTYPEGGGLSNFVFGMYSDLRAFNLHTFAFVGITSIRSDDADKGSTPADGAAQKEMDDFTLLPTNGLVSGFYRAHYETIAQANLVLQLAEELRDELDEQEYNTSRAEAHFIRGYLYFNLVRSFGGVPKIVNVIDVDDDFVTPRSSEAEIYQLIEEDLLEAIANLPVSWDEFFMGRVTKSAAEGMLAKVYLYQKRWGEALPLAQSVIASGLHDLNTSYDQIFTEDGENNSGSIFEVQALRNADFQTNDFGSQYGQVQGVRGSGEWNLGWGFNSPSQNLVDAYEDGDPRRDATILFAGETTPYGETVPDDLPNPRYNQKVYTDPAFRLAANAQAGVWVNIRLLRYADVVLMAAEAANELGQTGEALEKLEWIRARARGTADILPEVTTTDKDELRLAIQHERRIELAMEHERFFDLVRWGIAREVLHAAGKTNYTVGKHELLPIPQGEIDLSGNVLMQNPGY